MGYLNEFIIMVAIFLGVAAFFNGEKLRKRLNGTENALIKKGVVTIEDIRDDK